MGVPDTASLRWKNILIDSICARQSCRAAIVFSSNLIYTIRPMKNVTIISNTMLQLWLIVGAALCLVLDDDEAASKGLPMFAEDELDEDEDVDEAPLEALVDVVSVEATEPRG